MEVETYETTEVYDSQTEDRNEAFDLVAELGLAAQERFFENGKDALPYRKLTAEEGTVYATVFSSRTPLEKYGDDPIPVRVLQVAAHARQYFNRLMVWHCPNADIKDPVLVGENGEEWQAERFILARWGDCLLPFSQLRAMAGEIKKSTIIAACRTGMAALEAKIKTVEALTGDQIILAKIADPYVSA